jgi:hypothetical protein
MNIVRTILLVALSMLATACATQKGARAAHAEVPHEGSY